jgi:hypothetical protein
MGLGPIIIKLASTGVEGPVGDFKKVAAGAEHMGNAVEASGKSAKGAQSGLEGAARGASDLGSAAQTTSGRVDALANRMEKVRNFGAGMGLVSAGVLAIGENSATAFVEADRLGGRLESMMTGKGLQAGIDQVKALGNEIAGLTGGDDDEVSTAIGSAIASGRLNSLREYGIVIDANGKAAIEAAGKISEQAKSQEILNQVLRAGKDAAEVLRSTMDASTATIGEFNVRVGNLQEGIGKGSAQAKASIINNILSPLMSVVEASPGLQKTVGGILEIGGSVGAIGGPMIGLAGQIGMMRLGFAGCGAAGVGAFRSMAAAAITAGPAIWGALAPALPVLLGLATTALLAAGALYGLDKAMHWKEDHELATNIAKGDEAGQKLLDIENAKRVKKGKKALTMEEFQGDPNIDDTATKDDPASQLDDLKKQVADMQAGKMPTVSIAVPVASPIALAALPGSLAAAPSALPSGEAPGAASTLTTSASEDDPYSDQIRQLTRQRRDLKGKQNAAARDALTAQIDGLQDSERQWRESHKDAVKAQKAGEKLAKENEKSSAAAARDSAALRGIQLRNQADAKIAPLEDALDQAREAKDSAKIEALTLQIELAKAQEAREEALMNAELETDAAHKQSLIAQINATFDGAAATARRAAHRAAHEARSSGKDGSAHDEAVRAALQMSHSSFSQSGVVNALNPAGSGAGDRFAQAKTPAFLTPENTNPNFHQPDLAAMASFHNSQAINAMLQQSPNQSAMRRGESARGQRGPTTHELTIKSNVTQDADGGIVIKLNADPIKLPYHGIGNLGNSF